MTHIGLAIDPQTNDLFLDGDSKLAVVKDAEAVGQHVRQRLMTFEGEWFLDTEAGIPWIGTLLGKQYDPALAEAVVKAEILETNGVTEISSFSVSFVRDRRELAIKDVEVMTIYNTRIQI